MSGRERRRLRVDLKLPSPIAEISPSVWGWLLIFLGLVLVLFFPPLSLVGWVLVVLGVLLLILG